MTWPAGWVPIQDRVEGAAFSEELRAELSPGHCLFGIPLHAIGRCVFDSLVLFALDDGSGRVAQVILPWQRRPLDPPFPGTDLHEGFPQWARAVEYAEWLRGLKPDPAVVPRLKEGDRCLMVRHADWKADCLCTVERAGRPRIVFDGSTRVEYFVEFDEPQKDLTDEWYGKLNEYTGTTVLEEYLRPLNDERADKPGTR